MDEIAKTWRDHMLTVMKPHRDTPLLLSGGMDSGTILAAALALDGRPPCYSFRLGDRDSKDSKTARCMCKRYKLDHVVVDVPRDLPTLWSDLPYIIQIVGSRKAAVQCAWPLGYVARRMRDDGVRSALVGTGGVVEDNRELAFLLRREGEEAARETRRANHVWTGKGNATEAMHLIMRYWGVHTIEPYVMEPLAGYGLSLDVRELNRPGQKGIARRAFPIFYRERRFIRANSPLQVNSGVREWHDELLYSEHNTTGATAVVQMYRAVERELSQPRLELT